MDKNEKCEVSFCRLKITVPDDFSIEKYRKLTETVLLYPGHFIHKEADDTYTLEDEAGDRVPKVDIETIVKCGAKEASMNLGYLRLEGLPKKIAISEIAYHKPSTKETLTVGQ